MSSARLYVGRLSYKARERDIEDLFGRYGRIREVMLKNGFGFVEYDDPRDAEEALYKCNGKELRGERIIVEITRRPPRGRDNFGSSGGSSRRDGGGGGGRSSYSSSSYRSGGGSGGRDAARTYPTQTKYRVIIENISSRVSWQDLKDVMRSAGEVTYADAHRIKPGEGVVCYRRSEDLKRAMDTLDGKEVNGRRIKLIDGTRESRSRSKSSRRSRSRSRSKSSRSHSRSKSASSRSRSRSPKKSTPPRATNGDAVKRSRSRTPVEDGAADAGVKRAKSGSRSRSASPAAQPDPAE